MTELYEWIVGGLLVILYAHGRFHTPKTNIGSTTLFRYYSAAALYYGATLLLFVFLSAIAASSPQLFGALQLGGAESVPASLKGLTSPIMAALLMTALLPNFPILSEIDRWMLKLFRDLGNIPLEVRSWRDRLARSELRIPAAARHGLLRRAVDDPRLAGITEADLQFDPDDSPRYHFTRLIYLMGVLENFSTGPRRYPRVLEDFAEEYASIKVRFEQTVASASRCFTVIDKHASETTATAPLTELRRGFRERCDALYSDMCQLLARGILLNEASQHDRKRKLRELGYDYVDESRASLDLNQVLTVASVVGLILFSGVSIMGSGESPGGPLFLAVMVAAIYGAAVVCAVAPKIAWRFADITQTGQRPVAAYLLSGVLAIGCGLVVQLLFKLILFRSFYDALVDMGKSYPWLFMTFCVAVSLAYLADDWGGRAERAPRWARAAEAVAEGAILGLAFLQVQRMLERIDGRMLEMNRIVIVIAIGLFLGAAVPHWFRKARAARRAEEEAALPDPHRRPGQLA
ncbi:MAG TPA: hypothetical protein VLW45_06660 [Pelomicrobium sp.]|nr:hypothetical protein [Pelomicrobium sp.]